MYVYSCISLHFVYSCLYSHLGCFYLSSVNVATNTAVQRAESQFFNLFGIYLCRSGIAGPPCNFMFHSIHTFKALQVIPW